MGNTRTCTKTMPAKANTLGLIKTAITISDEAAQMMTYCTGSPCGATLSKPQGHASHCAMFHLIHSLMMLGYQHMSNLSFTTVCLLAASVAKPANCNSIHGV